MPGLAQKPTHGMKQEANVIKCFLAKQRFDDAKQELMACRVIRTHTLAQQLRPAQWGPKHLRSECCGGTTSCSSTPLKRGCWSSRNPERAWKKVGTNLPQTLLQAQDLKKLEGEA